MRLLIAVVMMCGCASSSTQGLTAVDAGEPDADRRADGAADDLLTVAGDLATADMTTVQPGDMAQVAADMAMCTKPGQACTTASACCAEAVNPTYLVSGSAVQDCVALKCCAYWFQYGSAGGTSCTGNHFQQCQNCTGTVVCDGVCH